MRDLPAGLPVWLRQRVDDGFAVGRDLGVGEARDVDEVHNPHGTLSGRGQRGDDTEHEGPGKRAAAQDHESSFSSERITSPRRRMAVRAPTATSVNYE